MVCIKTSNTVQNIRNSYQPFTCSWLVITVTCSISAQSVSTHPCVGNILKTTANRFQRGTLTTGECDHELLVATGQLTILLDGDGHRTHTVSNADAGRDKTNV